MHASTHPRSNMSTAALTMTLQQDERPKKSSFYLPRNTLLWTITSVVIGLATFSVVELSLKLSSRNMRNSSEGPSFEMLFEAIDIQYPDGYMFVPQSGYGFFRNGDELLLASAAICLGSSLLAGISVFRTTRKGPWMVWPYDTAEIDRGADVLTTTYRPYSGFASCSGRLCC